jgi:ribosomal protein S18 acetylase RimI-like enzyme
MARLVDYSIRRMVESDLPAVAEVEAGVFTDWYRVYRRQPEPLAERSLEELRYASSHDPDGNWVAVAAEGSLVGFIMVRTWGKVGWFGTFGVPTQFQGMGIGKALVDRAVDYLSGRCTVVGLETMPESGANIGLYTRAGFTTTYPTHILDLSLIKSADRLKGLAPDEVVTWSGLGAVGRARACAAVREISDALLPGLDFSSEVQAISAYGLGKTMLAYGSGNRLDGFVILRTAPFRNEDASGRAYIHALAVRPGSSDAALDALIRQVWTYATSLGLSRVAAGLNGRYHRGLALMIESGFRVVRSAVRMVRSPVPQAVFERSDGVEASRWAG